MKPNDKAYQEAADEIRFNSGLDLSEDVCSELAKISVDAAYAAQFPPSEEYAGLIKMLRSMHKQIASAIKQDDPWGIIDETVPSKAADALEAVLAERDALKAELAAANKRAANRLAVEAERDAELKEQVKTLKALHANEITRLRAENSKSKSLIGELLDYAESLEGRLDGHDLEMLEDTDLKSRARAAPDMRDEITLLSAENEKLREALEFYGWAEHWVKQPYERSVIEEDKGHRARAALEGNPK